MVAQYFQKINIIFSHLKATAPKTLYPSDFLAFRLNLEMN